MVRKIRKWEEVEIQREIFGMAMEEDLEEEMRKPVTLPGDSRISPSSCLEMWLEMRE